MLPEQLDAAFKSYEQALDHVRFSEDAKNTARSFLEHKVGEAIRAGVPFEDIKGRHPWAPGLIDSVLGSWRRQHGTGER